MIIENGWFATLPGIALAGEILAGGARPALTSDGMRAIEETVLPRVDQTDRRLDALKAEQSAEGMRDAVVVGLLTK